MRSGSVARPRHRPRHGAPTGPRGPEGGDHGSGRARRPRPFAYPPAPRGGTGARDEGPARSDRCRRAPSRPPPPRPRPSRRVDAVRLLKADPEVSAAVKRDLQAVLGDEYPVDMSYGKLTGGSADDIVVNVLTCGDAVGVGSYVYRGQGGAYENVFAAEEPPVYAEIDRGDLVVTQQVYGRATRWRTRPARK